MIAMNPLTVSLKGEIRMGPIFYYSILRKDNVTSPPVLRNGSLKHGSPVFITLTIGAHGNWYCILRYIREKITIVKHLGQTFY